MPFRTAAVRFIASFHVAAPLPPVGTQLEAVLDRSNLLAAFGHVAENGGCRGADGVTIGEFRARLAEGLDFLEASLRRRVYVPFPLLRIEVPKRSGQGVRVLAIPTVRDRVLQTAVDRIVRPIFEAEYEASSFAYREGRSVGDAVARVVELRDQGFLYAVDADVDACFDSIPHDPLLARLARLPLEDRHPVEGLRRARTILGVRMPAGRRGPRSAADEA